MTAPATTDPSLPGRVEPPSPRLSHQILVILGIEARKRFLGRGSIAIYLLAAIPIVLFGGRVVVNWLFGLHEPTSHDDLVYAALFRTLILRTVVFFGCVAIFTALFRGEVLDRSLHYYFLAPIRRPVLVVAKYLSGLLASMVLFGATTVVTWILLYAAQGRQAVVDRLTSGSGLAQLGAYVGVTALACVGYGSVFLAAGLFVRNPIIPALAILGWEGINFLLPPLLKKISVIHYLDSLCPVSLPPEGPIFILADPSSPWVAVPGLLGLATVLLLLSAWRVRRLEVLYGAE